MKYIINSFIIIALAAFQLACSSEEPQVQKVLRPVKYQEVGFISNSKVRTFSGTAQSDKIINLSFRNSGIITQLNIKLGQKVRRGQLLAKLDNVQARLAYEQSVTQLNSAASQMNTAKLNLNRVRALYEKGSASLSDFEAAKNSYKTAEESYNSAQRGVDIQKEQIQYGYIYAPESGTIATVAVEIDENVQPGQAIAVLNSGSDMEISLGIPESIINGVEQDMEVEVGFISLPGETFTGKVTEIAPAVDANTATYPILVTVTDASENIKSGMAANVGFAFEEQRTDSLLVVPAHAVGEDSNGRYVFLIENNANKTTVKKHPIQVGNLSIEGFEIVSGLTAGQKIATAGLQTLLNGQEVKLQ